MTRLRHRLLAVILVALGLIAMHQLSSGHQAATSEPADSFSVTAVNTPGGMHSTTSDAACTDCGESGMAFATCMLILIMLLVGAALGRPRWRLAPPGLVRRPGSVLLPRRSFRTALSLIELSISRT